jgi:hypothetical protein
MDIFSTIRQFACTGKNKEETIAAYRLYIKDNGIDPKNDFIQFMREVDNVCPDLALKAHYRNKIKGKS